MKSLKQEIVAHYPTALAHGGEVTAWHLRAWRDVDDRLRHILDIVPTEFDARPLPVCTAPQEPLFGHRVVHLLMRQEGNYLVNPRVLVDLTSRGNNV